VKMAMIRFLGDVYDGRATGKRLKKPIGVVK